MALNLYADVFPLLGNLKSCEPPWVAADHLQEWQKIKCAKPININEGQKAKSWLSIYDQRARDYPNRL